MSGPAAQSTPDSSLYAGERGAKYYAQRAVSRNLEIQQRRAEHFRDMASEELTLLDFGCGNGGVLAALPAFQRIGIEISPEAAADARTRLSSVHANLAEVMDVSIDRAISFHALEHVYDPRHELESLYRVVRPGGRIKLIVPFEGNKRPWTSGDIDMHLFSWTPLTFGNLVSDVGFAVDQCELAPMSVSKRLKSPLVARIKSAFRGGLQVVLSGHKPT
jgi:SAM-dependent methyltransferase